MCFSSAVYTLHMVDCGSQIAYPERTKHKREAPERIPEFDVQKKNSLASTKLKHPELFVLRRRVVDSESDHVLPSTADCQQRSSTLKENTMVFLHVHFWKEKKRRNPRISPKPTYLTRETHLISAELVVLLLFTSFIPCSLRLVVSRLHEALFFTTGSFLRVSQTCCHCQPTTKIHLRTVPINRHTGLG